MLPGGRGNDGWAGVTCTVTGGLGFIGGNLARRLAGAGASVRVVDALVPDHGGRSDQLDGVAVDALLVSDVADPRVADLVAGSDVVFNVAGQVSHTASMRDPQTDLYLNAVSHATFLETLRAVAPSARVVHTSTRQVYGRASAPRVDEHHSANPVDVNGVAKLAGEQLHMVYAHAHGMAATSLRLTNVYGPRQRLTSDELGFLPVFVRRALLGEEILIYGDGQQRRDCLHVDDVVDALVSTAADDRTVGRVFNVGHPDTHALADIADLVVTAARSTGGVRLVPWPDDHARIDIGSVHIDSSLIASTTGWRASIDLATGLADTVAFYRDHPCFLSST